MEKIIQTGSKLSRRQVLYSLPLTLLLLSSVSAVASVCIRLEEAIETRTVRQDAVSPSARLVSYENTPGDTVAAEVVDFEVQSLSRNRFRINFNNRSGRSVFVKIYDVIGNLIRHEKIDRKGKFRKEYDLSGTRTDFYVIEVGNENTSTMKRLFPS